MDHFLGGRSVWDFLRKLKGMQGVQPKARARIFQNTAFAVLRQVTKHRNFSQNNGSQSLVGNRNECLTFDCFRRSFRTSNAKHE